MGVSHRQPGQHGVFGSNHTGFPANRMDDDMTVESAIRKRQYKGF